MGAYNHNYLKFICNLMWKMISRMVELENKRQSARLTFSNLSLKQCFREAQKINVNQKSGLSYLRSGLFGNISKPSLILLQNSSKKKLYIKFKFHDDAWLINIIQNDIYLLGEEASFIPDKPNSKKEWNGTRKTIKKRNSLNFKSMLIYYHFNVLASPPFFKFSTCFFTRPRRFSYFDVSIEAARLRTDFPVFDEFFEMEKRKKN